MSARVRAGVVSHIPWPCTKSLSQRLVVRHHLRGLDRSELDASLAHRLRLAGCELPLFEPPAVEALAHSARGLPRLIHRIAHYALTTAAAKGARTVTAVPLESASIHVMGSLSALIVVHLRRPPLIPRVPGVSTMLAERGPLPTEVRINPPDAATTPQIAQQMLTATVSMSLTGSARALFFDRIARSPLPLGPHDAPSHLPAAHSHPLAGIPGPSVLSTTEIDIRWYIDLPDRMGEPT